MVRAIERQLLYTALRSIIWLGAGRVRRLRAPTSHAEDLSSVSGNHVRRITNRQNSSSIRIWCCGHLRRPAFTCKHWCACAQTHFKIKSTFLSIIWGQHDSLGYKGICHYAWWPSFDTETHITEREKWHLQIVLWPVYMDSYQMTDKWLNKLK